MNFNRVYIFTFGVALLGAFFLFPHAAQAVNEFFIDSSFDVRSRSVVSSTSYYTGNRARYFVEDSFLNALSSVGKNQLSEYVAELSDTFDSQIYQNVTLAFGLPWTPGIDRDTKITVLLTPMNTAGGYFRSIDESPKGPHAPTSNAREMIYLNAKLITKHHIKEFMAHEFQHLINYNQHTRTSGIQQDVWLNEMMSEVASIIALYGGEDFPFDKSNMRDRVQTFSDARGNALLDWDNKPTDYGIISTLGYYLYDKYGVEFYTALSLSSSNGLVALESALVAVSANKTFEQVFLDWEVAVLLNDCSVGGAQTFCYEIPDLNFDNLHISFNKITAGEDEVIFTESTESWMGNWFRYDSSTDVGEFDDTYLNISFEGSELGSFRGIYVVYGTDGSKEVLRAPIVGGEGEWSVADFGESVERVDFAFADFTQREAGSAPLVSYQITASLSEDPSQAAVIEDVVGISDIHDGDLIRATGTDDVYIVKLVSNKKFKRLILNPEVFNSYGHLEWGNVKTVSQGVSDLFTVSNLVIETNEDGSVADPKIYKLSSDVDSDTGQKQWLNITAAQFEAAGNDWDAIYKVNNTDINNYTTGSNVVS